jgi:DNA-binding protein H-NS
MTQKENSVAKRRKKQVARKQKKQNLTGMDVQSLLNLRDQIDEALSGYRSTLEEQLASLGGSVADRGARGGRGSSSLKGTKVPPKYRGPEGELWAGRGATPRWMKEAVKSGKKAEDFLIDKSGAKTATKSRTKK